MPELQLCVHCRKPIYERDDFVIPNKDEEIKEDWDYFHAQCYEEKCFPPESPEEN